MATTEATAEVKAIFSVVDQASAPIQKITENLNHVAAAAQNVAAEIPHSMADVAKGAGVAWQPGDILPPLGPAVTDQVTQAAGAVGPAIADQLSSAMTVPDKIRIGWSKLRDDIDRIAGNIGSRLRGAFESVEGVASRVGGKIASVLSSFGGTLAEFSIGGAIAAGIEFSFKGMEHLVEEVGKLGPRAAAIGIPIHQLQDLNRWADDAGVSTDALDAVLVKMTATLGEVQAGGNKKATEALEDLKISAVGAHGELRTTAEVLPEVIDALNAIHDPTRRDADALGIFKQRWKDLGPLITATSDKMKTAREEQDKIGHISDEEAARAKEYAAAHKRMAAALESMGDTVGAVLLPAITPLIELMTKWIEVNRKWLAQGLQSAVHGIGEAFKALGHVWKSTLDDVHAIGHAWEALKHGWDVFMAAMNKPLPDVWASIKAGWNEALTWISTRISGWGTELADLWKGALDKLNGVSTDLWGDVKDRWQSVLSGLASAAKTGWADVVAVFDWAWSKIGGVVTTIAGAIDKITGAFTRLHSTADTATTQSATAADQAAKNAEDAAQRAEDAMNRAREASSLPAPPPGIAAPGAGGAAPNGTVNVNITHANPPPGTRLNVSTQGNGIKTTAQTGLSMPWIQTPPPYQGPLAPPP